MAWYRLLGPFRFYPYEGGGGLPRRALQRVRKLLWRVCLLVEGYRLVADLRGPATTIEAPAGVVIRQATESDLPLFRWKPQEVPRRFARGDACFVALRDGEMIYSRWVCRRPPDETTFGMTVVLAPGEGYLYDAYAHPASRGLGLHRTVTGFAMNWMRENGFDTVTSIVLTTNHPAIRALRRLGLRAREKYVVVQCGRRHWIKTVPCDDPL